MIHPPNAIPKYAPDTGKCSHSVPETSMLTVAIVIGKHKA